MQREIAMVYIMGEWAETPYCDGIITRIRKVLNGKFNNKQANDLWGNLTFISSARKAELAC